MLPNFFVLGAQKAGTTTLHHYLCQHPQIYLPAQKETKFFVDDSRYAQGIGHYAREHFGAWCNEPAVGEVDPDYLYFEQALDRLSTHFDLATTRFVVVLRNPVDRAFSHYLMTYRRGFEDLAFEEALNREPERIAAGYHGKMHYSYAARGYYMKQLDRFLRHVDAGRMHFLLTEDLRDHPTEALRALFSFLDVDPNFIPENAGKTYHSATVPRSMSLLKRMINPSPEKRLVRLLIPSKRLRHGLRSWLLAWNQTDRNLPSLSESARARVGQRFNDENARLGRFIGRDLSAWNSASIDRFR